MHSKDKNICSFGCDEIANSFPLSVITGEKEKHGSYWYKLLTSRSSRVHKTVYERLHVLDFDSNRKVIKDPNNNIR